MLFPYLAFNDLWECMGISAVEKEGCFRVIFLKKHPKPLEHSRDLVHPKGEGSHFFFC
ncbi:hypothetical protein GCM10011391_10040 [Pullulanibacillus camelliae]|uniref:Uncharacterized protein n=1 Tax=Pullulanibacillus camelliae TaxID=1707096 RepID=A0A8J2YG86_9BACL|nr:hypothetical protein GCM10011391_10040 [Pullulanibacillus camelliae]